MMGVLWQDTFRAALGSPNDELSTVQPVLGDALVRPPCLARYSRGWSGFCRRLIACPSQFISTALLGWFASSAYGIDPCGEAPPMKNRPISEQADIDVALPLCRRQNGAEQPGRLESIKLCPGSRILTWMNGIADCMYIYRCEPTVGPYTQQQSTCIVARVNPRQTYGLPSVSLGRNGRSSLQPSISKLGTAGSAQA